MFSFLIKAKNVLLDILFPPVCINCRKYLQKQSEKIVCAGCLASIKINGALFCPVCRLRLAENKKICGHSKYLLAAAADYGDQTMKNLIHYFKYESFENLAPVLGKIMAEYLKNLNLKSFNGKSFVSVPIPLHPKREKRRGFNQSKLLADFISENFGLKTADELKRIKNNKTQAGLKNADERKNNINGCFEIKNAESIKNKNILLIDDVFTSGATMNEAVKTLKENGAKKIIALVAAKA